MSRSLEEGFRRRTAEITARRAADALPTLFTAIQEQLGLKLDAMKAPAKVMVIESVQKPSAN